MPIQSAVEEVIVKKAIGFSIFISLLVLFLTNCTEEPDQTPIEPDKKVIAFINVNLVTMTDDTVDTNQTVLIKGTRITAIGPSNEVAIPGDATIIDGEGAYLMPGLADMHMHTRADWTTNRWPVLPLYLYLANGVTTIRDFGPNGSDLTYSLRWRDEITSGTMIGPTLYLSGLNVRYDTGITLSPQEIVRWNYTQGFDFLKVYSYVSYADFQEAMATARQLGMYTAGHIPFPVGLEGVITEGYNEIAHIEELDWEFVEFNRDMVMPWGDWLPYLIGCILQQYDVASGFNLEDIQAICADRLATVISLLQSNNIPLCTTMIVDDLLVEKLFEPETFLSRPEIIYMPQDYLDAFNQGIEKHQRQFQGIEYLAPFKYEFDKMLLDELHRAGVRMLLSTDSGTATMGIVPGFSIHDELSILIENGFTPYEAIAAGTVNASKVVEAMIGEDDFGTIEVGKRADLILINGNPLDDVANIKNIIGVMAAGRWYSRQTLEDMIDF